MELTKDILKQDRGFTTKSALNLPYGPEIIAMILQHNKFDTILEIGTYCGYTAAL